MQKWQIHNAKITNTDNAKISNTNNAKMTNTDNAKWVGGVSDSQTRFLPLKKKKSSRNPAFFDPNFTFRVPKSHKNPGVGGGFKDFGKLFSQKK